MVGTLISLGANLGDPRESMHAAKRLLVDAFGVSCVRFSKLYRTPPVGGPTGQADFLNAVAAIETSRSAWEVWESIKSIETTLGRQRQHRWGARRIDIDLILYGDQKIWTPHLKVPHPRMCMRTFVLFPSLEVAAEWVDPVTQWTIQDLALHLKQKLSDGIRLIVPDSEKAAELKHHLEIEASLSPCEIQWSASLNERGRKGQVALTIAAVASPDPMNILWEDFSLKWASQMNLTSLRDASLEIGTLTGPRYLMPANDVAWAAHEIIAAHQAMQCNIEVFESL